MFVGLGIFTGHKIVQHWKKNETKEDFKEIFRLLNVSEGHYGDVLSSLTGFAGGDSFRKFLSLVWRLRESFFFFTLNCLTLSSLILSV